jgi:hypothetical protein
MSIQQSEQKQQSPQKRQDSTRRRWPFAVLIAVLMYIAPTINSILQQLISSKWTITIQVSGFQLNLVLLICELLFTWVIMGIAFVIGMFALPNAIVSLISKRKLPLPLRVVITIIFPLLLLWNFIIERWYFRDAEDEQ